MAIIVREPRSSLLVPRFRLAILCILHGQYLLPFEDNEVALEQI